MKNVVFWMSCRVALVRTDVSEERIASNNRVTRIGELRTLRRVKEGFYTKQSKG
jgi:hypothetical protein